MKQVININFHGRVVPIETTAFEILKNYTESLNRHFANEEGRDEIINDIESRIGELFQQRINKGATCITDEDVNAIIASIGRPEDFEPIEEGQASSSATPPPQPSSQQQYSSNTNTGHKRLYRDENNKTIGGVCAGLANYFNVDIIVVRIIFLILLFGFGFGLLPYIIMWVAVPSSSATQIGGAKKKLFRDTDDKIVAGVCSGLGNYFGINSWIPRALFLVPFLSFISRWGHWGNFGDFGDVIRFTFSPTSLIVYVILWIVIPEALTTSEKLEMKGEKVDMNSIKNSVMEEMKTVGGKAQKFGSEAGAVVNEKVKMVASDVQNFTRRNRGGLGNVIAIIAKIFAYFIIGVVCVALFSGLFALGVFSVGIFPLKDYVLRGGWQNFYAWGTLLLFIAVPIIAIITWLIRKLARIKSNSKILSYTFGSLWTIGWVCVTMLFGTVTRDFKSGSRLEDQPVTLSNPKVDKLIVTSSLPFTKKHYSRNWIRFEPFENLIDDDTAFVRNVFVEIMKSPTDSFQVTIKKTARGNTRADANSTARLINYSVEQRDSVLLLDKGIAINKTDKFRNQIVVVTVYVPVGKQIRVKKGIGWPVQIINKNWNRNWDNDYYEGNDGNSWREDVDYIMKDDGLYNLNGKKADGSDDDEPRVRIRNGSIDVQSGGSRTHIGPDGITVTDDEDNYRYNEYDKKADSLRIIMDKRRQQKLDSVEMEQKKLDSIKSKLESAKVELEEPITISAIIKPGFNILPNIN